MQILPHVYLADGFAYMEHPNIYLIQGTDGLIMVDCGTDEAALRRAEKNAAMWGLSLDAVRYLLITHSHYDHVGNAAAIRRRGAKIVAGPGDAEGIAAADSRTADYAGGFKIEPCPIDRIVRDGEQLEACGRTFHIRHAPGHSEGSIIYQLEHAGKTIWFTGDVVFPLVGWQGELGWRGGETFDRGTYIKTLKRLAAFMDVDCVLAGHYAPCLAEGHRVIGRAYVKALVEWR